MLEVFLCASRVNAASAENSYVRVTCDTECVERIVPVDMDFFITTRGARAQDFQAEVHVEAKSFFELVKPSNGEFELRVGETGLYQVENKISIEDSAIGGVSVLKLDIEPVETNICCQATGVVLKLTADSVPGGTAIWSSQPSGINGIGSSISFDPRTLSPGSMW